jgi:glutathione S-transferase
MHPIWDDLYEEGENMKLYYTPSVCSLAVRIILHELDIAFEFEAVNLRTKQTASGADYLQINPKGPVPTLVLDNNEILTENVVILQYLADTHHALQLLPAVGDFNRYRCLEWLNFASTDLHRNCAPLFGSRFSEETKNAVFRPILKNKLNLLNDHLQDNTYLMGDQFTLGDSYVLVILIWLAQLQTDMREWPNLVRYFTTLKQRKSVQLSLAEEDLMALSL